MIVVTVQYRLGYFGWLKYDPWGVEGNMGLRDLVLALGEFSNCGLAEVSDRS